MTKYLLVVLSFQCSVPLVGRRLCIKVSCICVKKCWKNITYTYTDPYIFIIYIIEKYMKRQIRKVARTMPLLL